MLSPNVLAQSKKFVLPSKRLVSGGIDRKVRVWEFKDSELKPEMHEIGTHDDWVRDVAWCDSIGL